MAGFMWLEKNYESTAVLVHVPDVAKGLELYKKAFPEAVPVYHPDFDFTALDLNGFSLEIVQADKKLVQLFTGQ